jgi:hypothetical protein
MEDIITPPMSILWQFVEVKELVNIKIIIV